MRELWRWVLNTIILLEYFFLVAICLTTRRLFLPGHQRIYCFNLNRTLALVCHVPEILWQSRDSRKNSKFERILVHLFWSNKLGSIPHKLDRQHQKAGAFLTFATCTQLMCSIQSHSHLVQAMILHSPSLPATTPPTPPPDNARCQVC